MGAKLTEIGENSALYSDKDEPSPSASPFPF